MQNLLFDRHHLGCAAVGFILGLIQILPELRRDRWAALLHRPVPRGVIYRGKAVAGLVLYFLATVSPFLLAVRLAATPGNFNAPFVPEMVFPGTVDICMGAAYYFAALATALQSGGWIGLRAFPLLAAIHTSCFVLVQKFFYVSVEASVLMALALFTAAWGEIHNQNSLRGRPWLGKAAFLAVVFYGVCGLGDLSQSFVNSLGPAPYANFERYELSDNGVPLHLTYGKGGVVISVQDLDGKPVADPRYQPDRVRNHISYLNGFSSYIGDSHGFRRPTYQAPYRETRAYMWANNPYSYPRMEQWFTLVKQNIMVGYLPQKKMPFAVLDQRGFEPVSAAPESFPDDTAIEYAGQDACCIWEPASARYAFLSQRKMVDLTLPGPGPIYGVGYAWGRTSHGSSAVIGITLSSGLAVYDTKANLIATLPYHYDTLQWGQLSMSLNGTLDRFYLRYDPSAFIAGRVKYQMPSYVDEMNAQGQVIHAYTLPPLPDHGLPRTWKAFLTQRMQCPAFYFGTMAYKGIGALFGSTRMHDDLARQFVARLGETEEFSRYMIGVALLLAVATLVWARRACFSWRRAWAWAGFVFAFSLPGFLTFRLAADWSRFVACPSCSRRRPIEAANCPHCGAGWPSPPSTGVEIFDRPASNALAPVSA